ncbi:MAG: hypothetical protein KGN00_07365 [Chloroflexota bacterium]|nr:hypothetical protein [Chloroflexota bacterium]
MSVPRHAARAAAISLAIVLSACSGATAPAAKATAASSVQPARVASPSAKPVPDTAATPRPMDLVGKFSLSPTHGPLGSVVTATGSGLKPQTTYAITWTSVSGSWKLSDDRTQYLGRDYKPVYVPMKSVLTDGVGGFTTSFTVPAQDFGFQHDVLVMDEGSVIRNKSAFDVDLEVTISPTSGPVGTPIAIQAKGLGWRDYQGSWLVAYDNRFTGLLSGVTTKGMATGVIPAAGGVGTHVVTVLGGDLTFMYLNVRQGPFPDRPEFRIPFTITDGPAVLPAPLEQQRAAVVPGAPAVSGLAVSPESGTVGSPMTLSGRALPANTDVTLTYLTQQGNRVGGSGFGESSRPLGNVRTDGSGSFTWAFNVPDDLGGPHAVVAKMGDKVVGQTQLTIQPNAFPLSIERGPSGTQTKVHLKGVGWTETANVYMVTYDNGYLGYVCGFNSAGDIDMTLPMTGEKGWHFIDMYPGIYKGKETQPFNYRMPQLSYARDHPGEDLPAFHFAFYVE